jgi:hypothetical protein
VRGHGRRLALRDAPALPFDPALLLMREQLRPTSSTPTAGSVTRTVPSARTRMTYLRARGWRMNSSGMFMKKMRRAHQKKVPYSFV